VISRNSAFTYKGRAVKVEDVGRELGVRYVLEGSVRRAGDRVRVTAQLIDASNGFHVWSEKYDRELADIFAVQSEIAERILGAVGANINAAELERIRHKPTDSLTAYDAFTRGMYHFLRFRRDEQIEARRWFERAIEVDPEYALAVNFLGTSYSAEYGMLWSLDESLLDRAETLMRRAMELDPSLPNPPVGLGMVQLIRQRPKQALTLLERAQKLAPSDYAPHSFMAIALLGNGRPIEALRELEQATRLNPRLSASAPLQSIRANIYANLGRVGEAVEMWERARADNPDMIVARVSLASHYAQTGFREQARAILDEALAVNPELTLEAVKRASFVPRSDGFLDGLRSAGLR
jgi:tetratricopeptide (TPR) repeat protein